MSSPARPSDRARAGIRSRQDARHRASAQGLVNAAAPSDPRQHRAATSSISAKAKAVFENYVDKSNNLPARAASPCESARSRALSLIHTWSSSRRLESATYSKALRLVCDPRRGDGPGRPRCRGRSPSLTIIAQIIHQLPQPDDGSAGRQAGRSERRRRNPSFSHRIGEEGVARMRVPSGSGGNDLCDHTIAIRHQDNFPGGGQAEVFAEFAFQGLDTHNAHR